MSTPNSKSLKNKWFSPCRRLGLSRVIKRPSVGTPSPTAPEPIREKHNSVETPQKSTETPKRSIETPQVTKTPESSIIRRALENNKRAKASDDSGEVETIQKRTETPKRSIETPKVTKTPETPTIRRSVENNKRAKARDSSGPVETAQKSETNCDKVSLIKISEAAVHESLKAPVVETPNRSRTNKQSLKSKNKSEPTKKLETKKENVMKECTVRLHSTDNKPSVLLVSDSKLNIPSPKKNVETEKSHCERKKLVKRLSMKKIVSADSEDVSDDDFNISKSSAPNSQVEVLQIDDEIVSKPKRRRAVLSSSEDEDFVSSQKSNKDKAEDNLQLKVQELSEEINRKSLHLHDLQQASVYRNLHNLKELQELTQTWKNGCVSALRMLLKNLQDHGPMNMSTLLAKLQVPSDFLSYNTDNDVFL